MTIWPENTTRFLIIAGIATVLMNVLMAMLIFNIEPRNYGHLVFKYGDVVYFSGHFDSNVSKRVEELLDEDDVLSIRSPGGLVDEGYKMAEVLGKYNTTVYVDEECLSACAIAIAPSKNIIGEGVIGLHRTSGIVIIDKISDVFVYNYLKEHKPFWAKLFWNTDHKFRFVDVNTGKEVVLDETN